MKALTSLYDRTNMAALRFILAVSTFSLPGMAFAQPNPADGMVDAVCRLIGPLVGRSKVVSLIFLIALAVMIFLWWMSENKEGAITWILRTGLALGILINIFTFPQMMGLPSVCSGF